MQSAFLSVSVTFKQVNYANCLINKASSNVNSTIILSNPLLMMCDFFFSFHFNVFINTIIVVNVTV